MARKALIRTSDGLVVNIIVLDDGANWQPPEGHVVVDAEAAGPGDTWNGIGFLKPAPLPQPPLPEPPIIGVMDAVLRARGLAGLNDAEKEKAREALR